MVRGGANPTAEMHANGDDWLRDPLNGVALSDAAALLDSKVQIGQRMAEKVIKDRAAAAGYTVGAARTKGALVLTRDGERADPGADPGAAPKHFGDVLLCIPCPCRMS